ncbi:MAG: hypothetical protein QXP98_09430 [Thermoproteus sp.]
MYQEAYYQINMGRKIAAKMIAEMAYMGFVGTLSVPPFGVLRRPLSSVLRPEVVSALALGILNDEPDVVLNSNLGIKLGGVPACSMLSKRYHELGVLCSLLKRRGAEPLYAVLDELVPSLGVALSNLGLPEGDLLISALRVLEGEASSVEQARLFKQYDEWGLYAHVNVRRSGRKTG